MRPEVAAQGEREVLAGAERRHLTVLFCDLVGSTSLGQQLDPEDFGELIASYHSLCAQVIQAFHGHVAQYQGDGVLAYFGYPHAQGDDAVHAVRAGIELARAVKDLSASRLDGREVRPSARVGIHTGVVVLSKAGAGAGPHSLAIGDTVNVAARLEKLADADTVVVSAVTERVTRGYFVFARLDPAELKGVAEPVSVYRVVDETGIRTRLALAAAAGLTPLVGRGPELESLAERWRLVLEGQGQSVLVRGEPGMGKSRIVHELGRRVGDGATRLVFQASPYYASSPLHPVVEELERVFRIDGENGGGETLARLREELELHGLPVAETAPLFASLLGIPLPSSEEAPEVMPQEQKRRTLAALNDLVSAEAERRPVLAVFEDLHWADPSTLALLELMLTAAPRRRVLVVMTARPEFQPPWFSETDFATLDLRRLEEAQVDELMAAVLGRRELRRAVLSEVAARTEGVPLFIEETLKMILESDARGMLEIPRTLENPLTARLDSLGPAKEVAQLASVAALGGEFSYELLRAVSHVDDRSLSDALAQLVRAELLYERGTGPDAVYVFKHALIREAAYGSLLRSARRMFHARLAQVLEESFPELVEAQPELIAQHLTEAGRTLEAVGYWQRSGERALQKWATHEAATHFGRGLELLDTFPEGRETNELELGFQLALGMASMAARGYAAPEAETAFARAETLSRELGDPSRIGPALYGLGAFYATTAQQGKAHDLGLRLLAVAEEDGDEDALIEANVVLGVAEFLQGNLLEAEAREERALASWKLEKHRGHIFVYGQEPGLVSMTMKALTCAWLGRVDEALHFAREAEAGARELAHPLTLAFTLGSVGILQQVLLDVERVEQTADDLVALTSEYGLPMWLAWGRTLRGWALFERGRGEEGLIEITYGMAAADVARSAVMNIHFQSQLGEEFAKLGYVREGRAMVEEAFAALEPTEERVSEAELHRSRGVLHLLADGDAAEADACFRRGIDVARRQHALLLELRSATALAELWAEQGRVEEARALLGGVTGRFAGGADAPVLRRAGRLLAELSAD